MEFEFDVYFGRLVTITSTIDEVKGIKNLRTLNKIVSNMLGCNVKIKHKNGSFEVYSKNKDLIWDIDEKYRNIIITTEGTGFVRTDGTEYHLESICEEEIRLTKEEIELIKNNRENEVLNRYNDDFLDGWEWVEIKDEKEGIAVLGKYPNEVCVSF